VILDDGGASPDSGPAADAADGGPPCELGTFYLDADGDGHGVGSVIATACELPAGFALTSDDCDDTDERAFPGQLGYFSTSRPGGSFDFDCDAKEDKEIVNIDPRYCLCGNGNCSVTRGWKDAVPECGVSQDYSWLPVSSVSCEIAYVTKIQGCR
jgi:hypothetical protein